MDRGIFSAYEVKTQKLEYECAVMAAEMHILQISITRGIQKGQEKYGKGSAISVYG